MPIPYLKNKGPLLVDKVRGYFDRLPPWLREMVTIRVEHQKVDAKISDLDPVALTSELKQEITDEKLRTSRYLGDGADGSGNDMSLLPASNLSEVVIQQTGQVADVTETVSATESHLVEGPPLQDGTSEQVGDLWVTKKVEAPTFDKAAYQVQKDDTTPQQFRAGVPATTVRHTVNGTAAMPTLGTNELTREESQVKVGVKETSVTSRNVGTAPVLHGQKIDPEFNGVVTTGLQSIVPDTTAIAQVFGVTDDKITPYGDGKAVRERWTTGGTEFPMLTQYNYDSEINTQIITEVSIVPAAQTYSPTTGTVEYNERKIDAQHKMRVVNRVAALPSMEVNYITQPFTFPGLLYTIDFKLVVLGALNRSEVQWTAGVRASFTAPAQLMQHTEYFLTQPQPNAVVQWAPGDVTYKGVSFSVSLTNMLYNTWASLGVTFAGDAYYGNIIDRFSITATAPSATTYIGWIGQNICIGSIVKRYKRLWMRTNTFVVAR